MHGTQPWSVTRMMQILGTLLYRIITNLDNWLFWDFRHQRISFLYCFCNLVQHVYSGNKTSINNHALSQSLIIILYTHNSGTCNQCKNCTLPTSQKNYHNIVINRKSILPVSSCHYLTFSINTFQHQKANLVLHIVCFTSSKNLDSQSEREFDYGFLNPPHPNNTI